MATQITHRPPRSSGSGESRRDEGPSHPGRRRFLGLAAGGLAATGLTILGINVWPRGDGDRVGVGQPAAGNLSPRDQAIGQEFFRRINDSLASGGWNAVSGWENLDVPTSAENMLFQNGYWRTTIPVGAGTISFSVGQRLLGGVDKLREFSDAKIYRERRTANNGRVSLLDARDGTYHMFTAANDPDQRAANLHMAASVTLDSGNPFRGRPYGITHDVATADRAQHDVMNITKGFILPLMSGHYYGNPPANGE